MVASVCQLLCRAWWENNMASVHILPAAVAYGSSYHICLSVFYSSIGLTCKPITHVKLYVVMPCLASLPSRLLSDSLDCNHAILLFSLLDTLVYTASHHTHYAHTHTHTPPSLHPHAGGSIARLCLALTDLFLIKKA